MSSATAKERDVFAEQGIRYAAPFVSLDEPRLVPKQLWEGLDGVIPGLTAEEDGRRGGGGLPRLTEFKIRVETIAHYLEKYAGDIIRKKAELMPAGCPLLPRAPKASLTGV